MPMMPVRGCSMSGCPNRAVPGEQYCEEHLKLVNRQYDAYTRAPDHHKKYGRAWKRIRDRYARSHPVCERCLAEGRITTVEEVHHIVPVSKGGQHVDSNLMSLCQSCHTKIHIEMGERNHRGQ